MREATDADVPAITALVQRTVNVSNRGDYSDAEISRMLEVFSLEHILERMAIRTVLVALIEDRIVGTASLDKGKARVQLVFVDPTVQGGGLGAMLMEAIENRARSAEMPTLNLYASRTAIGFYASRGYIVNGVEEGDAPALPMIKQLV